ILPPPPHARPRVVESAPDPSPSPCVARRFFHQTHVSELPPCRAFRLFRVYAALHASLCGHAQVRPQFLVELRLVGFPAPEDHRVLTKSFLLPMANRLKSRPGLARRP